MSARRALAPRAAAAPARALVATLLLAPFALGGCAATGTAPGPDAPSAPSPESGQGRWSDDVFALSERADRAYREGRWIEAARLYGELAERVPEDAYAWFRLGNTFAQQGAFDRAVHAYERSLERDAGRPKPWFNLSTAYLLEAQRAMTRAWSAMRPGDPARAMIERRLAVLNDLMHDRIEDDAARAAPSY